MQLAPALGGFVLATELAGALYDRQAAAQGERLHCRGSLCFRCACAFDCVVYGGGIVTGLESHRA